MEQICIKVVNLGEDPSCEEAIKKIAQDLAEHFHSRIVSRESAEKRFKFEITQLKAEIQEKQDYILKKLAEITELEKKIEAVHEDAYIAKFIYNQLVGGEEEKE